MASLLELKQLQMGGELYLRTQGQMSPGQPLSIILKVPQSSFDCIKMFWGLLMLLISEIQVQKSEKS